MSNETPSKTQHFEAQLAAGKIIPVERADLLLPANPDPIFATKDASGKELPVYVEVSKGEGNNLKPSAELMAGEDGKQYVLINEGYHKWNEDYARQEMAKAENKGFSTAPEDFIARLKENITNGSYKGPSLEGVDIEKRFNELKDFATADAREKGIDGLRLVIGPPFGSDAEARMTKDGGAPVVALNSYATLEALASDQSMREMKAIISHENKHIIDGDVSSARVVAETHNTHNDKTREMLADRGVNDTEAATANMKRNLTYEVASYNQANPDKQIETHTLSFAQVKDISDWQTKKDDVHPSILDRIAGFELPASLKAAYEKGHSVVTPEDRKKEADTVNAQVMQQYKDHTLPDPPSLKGGMTIPDSVKLLVEDMKPLPMKEAETHAAPSAPAPVKETSGPHR